MKMKLQVATHAALIAALKIQVPEGATEVEADAVDVANLMLAQSQNNPVAGIEKSLGEIQSSLETLQEASNTNAQAIEQLNTLANGLKSQVEGLNNELNTVAESAGIKRIPKAVETDPGAGASRNIGRLFLKK